MSAVTVKMLNNAWRALELERAQGTGWSAFTHYHDLLGKAPLLVRLGHRLRTWRR